MKRAGLLAVLLFVSVFATGTGEPRAAVIAKDPCRKCGAKSAASAKFCTACGTALSAEAENRACPQCLAKATPGQRFCGRCGLRLAVPRPPIVQKGVFTDPSLGLRLAAPARSYDLKNEQFKFDWPGTRCEVVGKEGRGGSGVLCLYFSGMRAKAFADWREDSWRQTKGVKKVARIKEEPLKRDQGEWIRREIVVEYASRSYHYLETFVSRGSRNLDLELWCEESLWEKYRDDLYPISNSLVFAPSWSCPSCLAEFRFDSDFCGQCGGRVSPTNADLAKFSRKFRIQIISDPSGIFPLKTASGTAVDSKSPPDEAVEHFSALLSKELARYPNELFQKLRLEQIILCKELRRDGATYGGLSNYDTDAILFEITEGRSLKYYQTGKVHHELFHYIDFRDDGTITQDAEWEKLNPPTFHYDRKKKGYWGFDDKNEGFLDSYAMTAVEEDKAEVYCNLVVRPKAMDERAGRDAIMKKKIERMKELVHAYCPQIDDSFWAAQHD